MGGRVDEQTQMGGHGEMTGWVLSAEPFAQPGHAGLPAQLASMRPGEGP